jgi:hypothetical protein
MRHAKGVYLDSALLTSLAWRSLKTLTAFRVYIALRLRCVMYKDGGKRSKGPWRIGNNGEIVLTYREAAERYGIKPSAFRNAIRELSAVGLIDYQSGCGVRGVPSVFAISERWRHYGTAEYVGPKPAGKQRSGFRRGNGLGRNSRQEKFVPTVTDQHKYPASVLSDQHKPLDDEGDLCCCGNMGNRPDSEVNQ